MTKSYYLKATGAACYNKTHIYYPEIAIKLNYLVERVGGVNIVWKKENGMSNQPKVITFDLHETTPIKYLISKKRLPLILKEHW